MGFWEQVDVTVIKHVILLLFKLFMQKNKTYCTFICIVHIKVIRASLLMRVICDILVSAICFKFSKML